MCWQSTICPRVKIAEEDMKVYKIMWDEGRMNELNSFYQLKRYEIGKEYVEKDIRVEYPNILRSYYVICKGFHSYSGEMVELKEYDGCWIICSKFDNRHLDVIRLFDEVRYDENLVAVECVIPKGSMYCENENGEIVSDHIIITNKIFKEYNSNRGKELIDILATIG